MTERSRPVDSNEIIRGRCEEFIAKNSDSDWILRESKTLSKYGVVWSLKNTAETNFQCLADEQCAKGVAISLSGSSSSNGTRHLREIHGVETTRTGAAPTAAKAIPSLTSIPEVAAESKLSEERIMHVELTKMVIFKNLPFNFFEGNPFGHVYYPCGGSNISNKKIKCVLLEIFDTWIKLIVKPDIQRSKSLSSLPNISLLVDEYKQKVLGLHFLGVRICFLGRDYRMKSFLIALVPYSHSIDLRDRYAAAELVKTVVANIFTEFGISLNDINCICSDHGPSVYAGCLMSAPNHIWCFAHFLDRVMSASVGGDAPNEMKALLKDVKDTVNGVENSPWFKKFFDEQMEFQANEIQLKSYVENRWQSISLMFERIIRDYDVLRDCYLGMGKIFPIAEKLPIIIQIYSLIRPISDLIEYAQQSSTFSPLVGLIRMLRNYLTNSVVFDRSKPFIEIDARHDNAETEKISFDTLQPLTQTVCDAIRLSIYKRFLNKLYYKDQSRILDAVMFFHPRYRLEHVDVFVKKRREVINLLSSTPQQSTDVAGEEEEEEEEGDNEVLIEDEAKILEIKAAVRKMIMDKMAEEWTSRQNTTSTTSQPSKKARKKRTYTVLTSDDEEEEEEEKIELVSLTAPPISQSSSDDPMQKNIENELREYEKITVEKKTRLDGENLLIWWKDHAAMFPLLSEVARSLLGVPGSSGSLERDFCFGRMIGDPFRSRIESVIFATAMVLRINFSSLPASMTIQETVSESTYKASLPEWMTDPFQTINETLVAEEED